jgi:hypothetical protein
MLQRSTTTSVARAIDAAFSDSWRAVVAQMSPAAKPANRNERHAPSTASPRLGSACAAMTLLT